MVGFGGEHDSEGEASVQHDADLDHLDLVEHNPLDAVTFLAAASHAFYLAEKDVNSKIKTYIDAFYYISTCASVGYADIFAAKQTGRAIAAFVMIVGPALAARSLDRPCPLDADRITSSSNGLSRWRSPLIAICFERCFRSTISEREASAQVLARKANLFIPKTAHLSQLSSTQDCAVPFITSAVGCSVDPRRINPQCVRYAYSMNPNIHEIFQILAQIIGKLNMPDCDGVTSFLIWQLNLIKPLKG